MKKQFLLALTLLVCGATAVAQPRGAGVPTRLLQAPQGLMAPVWSPDGTRIAATGDNYTGIIVMNADGSEAVTVTDAPGAGYKMSWTADGKEIVGRTNIYENARIYHEMKAWSADGRADRVLRAKHRTTAAPTMRAAGLSKKSNGVYDIMTSDPAKAASQIDALNGYADKVVINPALSPDGTKVAFQIGGAGMWVINSDGSGLKSLGKGSNPSWMPDSRSIVYTVVTDDGERYTGSTLYGLDTENGNSSVIVSQDGLIPVTPAVSPDGTRVVFQNVTDASLYIVNIK